MLVADADALAFDSSIFVHRTSFTVTRALTADGTIVGTGGTVRCGIVDGSGEHVCHRAPCHAGAWINSPLLRELAWSGEVRVEPRAGLGRQLVRSG